MFDKVSVSEQYKKVIKKIRSFLLSASTKEFLIFLFFVFISFCFWLMTVLNDDYESDFNIKLNMRNVPDNVVMTAELPTDMRIRLKDRGTVLAKYWMRHASIPITLDFNDYVELGTEVTVPKSTVVQKIRNQLSQSTQMISLHPDSIFFIYTRGEGKKVPVKFQGSIQVDPKYYISGLNCEPDSVMVYAPIEILDTITAAYSQLTKFDELKDTTAQRIPLQEVRGAKFVPDYNDVTIMVDVYSEKTLEVPVHGMNFPPDKVLRTFPSKVKVTFQVGLSHFKTVTSDDFFIAVSYEELLNSKNSKCMPHLKASPSIVNHPRISPLEVDYIIEQQTTADED
ncbi:YbbR-like domain-containing protein [Phocaeicola oris]|uniref:YbbR-like domain-containing protein n=1 Tax=Phocaeicola oris TaxID=2896850 RepID=UPI00234E8BD8|nr:YbbR-like domain-containing protein [Phocaeicola oris]